jgi:hypothetical protein
LPRSFLAFRYDFVAPFYQSSAGFDERSQVQEFANGARPVPATIEKPMLELIE